MAQVILVRHGQSTWNLENKFTGWTDVSLTEKGIEEAKKASALCLINTIAVLVNATKGNLNIVKSCLKINVFINSANDFFEQI